jgi:hypothetical protein
MAAMGSFSAIVWPLLIYWLVFFVACYAACEVGQDFFYDEVNANVGIRSFAGSFLLAAMATWIKPSFETIFTANVAWTVLNGLVWVGVFMFILEFHPWHALGLGLVIMVLVSGLATMGVESLTKSTPRLAPARSRPSNQPVRKSLNSAAAASGGLAPKRGRRAP